MNIELAIGFLFIFSVLFPSILGLFLAIWAGENSTNIRKIQEDIEKIKVFIEISEDDLK